MLHTLHHLRVQAGVLCGYRRSIKMQDLDISEEMPVICTETTPLHQINLNSRWECLLQLKAVVAEAVRDLPMVMWEFI